MDFNAEQKAAIAAQSGSWVCIAGPGSGKTTVLVNRHLALIMSMIPEKDILNLTFTSAAAEEMVGRVGLLNAKSVFRTFHSFAMELLKNEKELLSFPLCDTIIPVEMQDYQLFFDLAKIYPVIKWPILKEKISKFKCDNVTPDQALELSDGNGTDYYYALAYRDYEKKCREQGWLDFDSIMQEAVGLLEKHPEVRDRWKKKFISVDECQDTDIVQFQMLQLLFDGNIFAVGDENQSIFEFRNAQPDNLRNFASKFPGANTLYLGQNYRSTKKLVDFFKKILPFDNGIASHMFTENEEGEDVRFVRYFGDREEAESVLKAITDPINTVIIARTNRQLFVYQKLCTLRGIKYKILGKKDFWEQPEVKKLLDLAKKSDSNQPAYQVLTDLIQRHRLIEIYKQSAKPTESSPVENLNSIVKMAAKKGNTREFLAYLKKLTYARRSNKGLTLSTVHQAKGRQYNDVFVIGCNEGTMPHKDSTLAEESRIFFVACSRTAKRLVVSFNDTRSMFLNDFQDQIEIYSPEDVFGED